MLNKFAFLKQQLRKNKRFVENFSYLSLTHIVTIVFPLLMYPYLVSVLGLSTYGFVIFAQVVATYFSVFIAYGFNTSGAKDIATCNGDKVAIGSKISNIICLRLVLFIISFLILILGMHTLDVKGSRYFLFLFSFFICLNDMMFPQWFFQGIEKIYYSTIINLSIRSFFLVLTLLFVNNESDFLLVPIFNACGGIAGGAASFYLIFKKEAIPFITPSLASIFDYLKNNVYLFLSDLIISIKERFSLIFIGLFLGMSDVAIFDLSMKCLFILLSLITVLNQSVLPKMAISKDIIFLKQLIKYSLMAFTFIAFCTVLLLNFVIQSFFTDYAEYLSGVNVLLFSVIIMSVSVPLSQNGLVVFNKYELYFLTMAVTAIFYVSCLIVGYYLDLLDTLFYFCVITVLTYSFELCCRYLACKKSNIL